MGKQLPNVLELPNVLALVSDAARANCSVNTMFLDNPQVKVLRFWPEHFDEICAALKYEGHYSGGFTIGRIRAVKFDEKRS